MIKHPFCTGMEFNCRQKLPVHRLNSTSCQQRIRVDFCQNHLCVSVKYKTLRTPEKQTHVPCTRETHRAWHLRLGKCVSSQDTDSAFSQFCQLDIETAQSQFVFKADNNFFASSLALALFTCAFSFVLSLSKKAPNKLCYVCGFKSRLAAG